MSKDLSFKTVTAEQVSELQQNFNLNFGYYDKSKSHYSHAYSDRKTTFSFVVRDEILPEGLERYFAAIGDEEQKGYFFSAVIDDSQEVKIINDEAAIEKAEHNLKSLCKIHESMLKRDQWLASEEGQNYKSSNQHQPHLFQSQPELVNLISEKIEQGKKLHFFTGAGLSVDAIPDWNGLMAAMGFDQIRVSEDNLGCSVGIIQDEKKLSDLMMQLHTTHKSFFEGMPSNGHQIIGDISAITNRAILTDNRDILHQVSGFDAIHVCQIADFQTTPWDPVTICDPGQIDGLVVCGMSGDQRGFIEWLKEKNPKVEIINMNLTNTLSKTVKVDHFIEGDLQGNLQSLKALLERTKVDELLAPSSVPENPQANSVVKGSKDQSVIP